MRVPFLKSVVAVLALGLTSSLFAAEKTFVVGEKIQFNNIMIESVTDLETIHTTSNKISGEIKWDADAKKGSAKLVVPVESLDTGIADRNGHLQGDQWLNAAKNPTITFETTEIAPKEGDKYTVKGNFTMNGVTKPITAEATFKVFKPELAAKIAEGADVAKISTAFEVKLSDHGIKLPVVGLKVSDALQIKVTATAISKK